MLGEGTHGPVAEHREQRARQTRAGQPEPAERGEPGPPGLRHSGHRAEHEPAAHQAPPRSQHHIEPGSLPERASRQELEPITLGLGDAGTIAISRSHT